ncbi:hypothetical protein [Candidatus Similichlamydia laticola]|uniref:Glucose-6-phosphate 1-dehydrogenase n=1 Tax=Candidatus Similichlamydia laticola TaxID=2170265 RepID=A0A369KKQ5_9BACT|nr:hypothetical protein [Candidatus Similichlamydia laticola]RDB31586.1 Glucose-6-phosphate 1-dehydrogenase [Candidatus Similichlamydia laticola]
MHSPGKRQTLVLFGVTGDLVRRKILPALYQLEHKGLLANDFCCLGVGRQEVTNKDLLEKALIKDINPIVWRRFASKFRYCKLQLDNLETYHSLKKEVEHFGKKTELLFFLAVSTSFFSVIAHHLVASSCWQEGRSSLFLEKPFGSDFMVAQQLQRDLEGLIGAENIHLIDHYLSKPGIGSLLQVRTLPGIASLWNKESIRCIQVVATESLGIEGRAPFYDQQGHIKDLVQSHLLQILSLTGALLTDQNLKEARSHFLKSLFLSHSKPIHIGQYTEGKIKGKTVCGYLDELGVASNSQTETFAAMCFESALPEWKGVFFEVFTGKRLHQKLTEVIILFHSGKRLVIRSFPDTSIMGMPSEEKKSCRALECLWKQSLSGYEAILMASFSQNESVFLSPKEAALGWEVLAPYFREKQHLHYYEAGSWGPPETLKLYSSIFEQIGRG